MSNKITIEVENISDKMFKSLVSAAEEQTKKSGLGEGSIIKDNIICVNAEEVPTDNIVLLVGKAVSFAITVAELNREGISLKKLMENPSLEALQDAMKKATALLNK